MPTSKIKTQSGRSKAPYLALLVGRLGRHGLFSGHSTSHIKALAVTGICSINRELRREAAAVQATDPTPPEDQPTVPAATALPQLMCDK